MGVRRLSISRQRPLALIGLAALDLRRHPNHQAELRSQLLMGETVVCLASDRSRQWARVENLTDGYRGWVRSWGLVPVALDEALAWRRGAQLRVSVMHAQILATPGGRKLVSPVFLNSRLAEATGGRRRRLGWRKVALPDGRQGWIESRALRPLWKRLPPLRRQIEGFLGIPYLWGGRTPMGFDCSGFVQQLFASRGRSIPRDADDQFRASRRLRRGDRGRAGDLIFFGPRRGRMTHVGVLIGASQFAHARGRVRVNSVDPDNPLYDSALATGFRARGRPVLK